MGRQISYLIALGAVLVAATAPTAAGETSYPDWWVGSAPECGDTTVASLNLDHCGDPSAAVPGDEVSAEAAAAAEAADAARGGPSPSVPTRSGPSPASCRYDANVIVYAASDWLPIGEEFAANASQCANYWIHIPTLAANKLACRVNQAHQIRAHGPRFHAMCEAHFVSWATWVRGAPGRTWYQAGVLQRAQMASVGFDVANGDTWSINELTSAVRRGDGNARANALEFMRGLFDGGSEPDIQGNAFVIGLAQGTVPTTVYKEVLKSWFADAQFWQEAAKYVRFWGQEAYGDIRNTLVPGVARNRRAESLNDYLQQVGMLAGAGPPEVATAQTYLRTTHFPLASAAWGKQPTSGFGFTAVPLETMQHFVGIQEFALRHYLGSNPQIVTPTVGYAWSPTNQFGLPPAEFQAEWRKLLRMLATSIAESFGPGGGTQTGACGPPGDHVWCDGEYPGAAFNLEWELLRTWE
jgi:hypothetical protein